VLCVDGRSYLPALSVFFQGYEKSKQNKRLLFFIDPVSPPLTVKLLSQAQRTPQQSK